MNDEIKEILESSRKIIKSNRENGFDRIIMLGDDIDKLLDYITNLQNGFKSTVEELCETTEKFEKLQEENDRLNNIINELEKYIRNYINLLVSKPDMIEQGQLDILYEVLDKLKALKEGKQ